MTLPKRLLARFPVLASALIFIPGLCPAQGVLATLMIDDYIDPQHVDTGSSNPDSSFASGSMIGGERILQLYTEVDGVPFGSTGQALDSHLLPLESFENLQLATSSSFDSVSTVIYNGVGGAGLGGVDLTQNGGDRFWFELRDHDHTADWSMTVVDTSSNIATHTVSFGAYASNPPDLVMVFSDFANFSGTDFTQIDRIEFQVASTQTALDFTLDFFAVGMVPEPSSALLLLTAAGLGLRRRRAAS